MQCNCQIINQSGQTISKLVLEHSPGSITPTSMSSVMTVTNLANGAASQIGQASQKKFTNDWWTMGVEFETGGPWIMTNPVLPMAECETPANGSAQFVIGSLAPGSSKYPVTIKTFKNADFTSSDGDCAESLANQGDVDKMTGLEKTIVKIILTALAALV